MDYFSHWKEKIRDKITALLEYFTEKPQQRIQEPESQPQPRQEEQSLRYRFKANMLKDILEEPLLSKRRAERGKPSPERKKEAKQLGRKMLENKYQKERNIKKKEISKRNIRKKKISKRKRYGKISDM